MHALFRKACYYSTLRAQGSQDDYIYKMQSIDDLEALHVFYMYSTSFPCRRTPKRGANEQPADQYMVLTACDTANHDANLESANNLV
jgi:hypothetical protein